MAQQTSGFGKVIRWLFNISYEYEQTKKRWQKRSAFMKILSLVITIFFLGLSCLVLYWTGKSFQGVHGSSLDEIVRSVVVFFGIFLLALTDVIFISSMIKLLFFNIFVAFTCRPKKQPKIESKAIDAEKVEISETINEINPTDAETADEPQKEASESNLSDTTIEAPGEQSTTETKPLTEQPKSKTSRRFDTTIGWINIILLGVYIGTLVLAFLGGYNGIKM